MKKTILLKYESPEYMVLADWVEYILFTETTWFWGLFKTQRQYNYKIYDHQNFEAFFKQWDMLIETKKPLK